MLAESIPDSDDGPFGRSTELLSRLLNHPCAPKWNHRAKDSLTSEDLQKLADFKRTLYEGRQRSVNYPGEATLEWVGRLCQKSPFYWGRIPDGNTTYSWFDIPTMGREDLVTNLEDIIPNDAPLNEMRAYRTAGTTGHPVIVPHSRVSVASYQSFIEYALHLHGIKTEFNPEQVACFLIGAQSRTVTYATTLSNWNNAGFAKINLDSVQWNRNFDCELFISEFNPAFLNGDPLSFSRLLELEVEISPKALVTTAVALSEGLRARLESRFQCPVIDWYSLTETGPIACKSTSADGYRVIAPDLFVECLDPDGLPVAADETGEITVTGGRNPFVPLVRYRTGDFGRLVSTNNGEQYLTDLEGRKPVMFKRADGSRLNSADISSCLRLFPVVQYEFFQNAELGCEVTIRAIAKSGTGWLPELQSRLGTLLGREELIKIEIDPLLGQRNSGGKVVPYRSELLFEE